MADLSHYVIISYSLLYVPSGLTANGSYIVEDILNVTIDRKQKLDVLVKWGGEEAPGIPHKPTHVGIEAFVDDPSVLLESRAFLRFKMFGHYERLKTINKDEWRALERMAMPGYTTPIMAHAPAHNDDMESDNDSDDESADESDDATYEEGDESSEEMESSSDSDDSDSEEVDDDDEDSEEVDDEMESDDIDSEVDDNEPKDELKGLVTDFLRGVRRGARRGVGRGGVRRGVVRPRIIPGYTKWATIKGDNFNDN